VSNITDLDEGRRLFIEGECEEAFKLLLPLAKKGIAEAESSIGLMYSTNEGVARDIPVAIKWLESSAHKGCGEAAHNLGTLYLTCEPDIPIDKNKSKKWYKKAKELGFITADDSWYSDE